MYGVFKTRLGMVALLGAAIAPDGALAADLGGPSASEDWTFTAAAYLWGAGVSGEAGVFGLPPQDIDIGFGDILEKLDFALMGLGEARKDRFLLAGELTYLRLSTGRQTPYRILADKVDVTSTSWMVSGYAGYSLLDSDFARIDIIGGGRLWSVDTDVSLTGGPLDGFSKSDGAAWVDPLVGVKAHLDLAPDVYAVGWGMIGGFGVGSDLMWDVMAGAGYDLTDSVSLFAGYRAISVDYGNDGFVYDVVEQGPVVAAVFQF